MEYWATPSRCERSESLRFRSVVACGVFHPFIGTAQRAISTARLSQLVLIEILYRVANDALQLICLSCFEPLMSAQLASGIKERLQEPTEGKTVSLIVGVDEDKEIASKQISEVGGEVEEELPYKSLAVSIDESNLRALCQLDAIESVELEKEYGTRGGSDFFCR